MTPPARSYRLLVTGSRYYPDAATIQAVLEQVRDAHRGWPLVLVHGKCDPRHPVTRRPVPWAAALRFPPERQLGLLGADWLADRVAQLRATCWQVERFPANWTEGRGAGFSRNNRMVRYVASGDGECAAFPVACGEPSCRKPEPHDSHGTAHCSVQAKKAGLAVSRWPAGQEARDE